MRAENESRLVLIALAVAVVVLFLVVVSLGAVLLTSQSRLASDTTVTPSTDPGSLTTTELPADAGQAATSSSPVPSATSFPSTTIAPTTPAQTESSQSPATGAPLATVPGATPTPVVAPTIPNSTVLTPAESTVVAPSAFVYDEPSSTASLIGGVQQGDTVVILGSSGTWYLIQVSSTSSPRSRIEGGQGWIAQDAVRSPNQQVPVITP